MGGEASKVLEGLYQGPITAAEDEVFLKKAYISHVVAVCEGQMTDAEQKRKTDILRIPVLDNYVTIMSPHFNTIVRFIHAARVCGTTTLSGPRMQEYSSDKPAIEKTVDRANIAKWRTGARPFAEELVDHPCLRGSVLVHCAAGVSRSSSATLAYLMVWLDVDYETALRHLILCRKCVCPNGNFAQQLKAFEHQSERKVLRAELLKMNERCSSSLLAMDLEFMKTMQLREEEGQ